MMPIDCWGARHDSVLAGGVEIDCETDLEYDVVEFRWKLRSFNKLRDIAIEKGLPPEGDVITSPMFIDSRGGCWWLRVYPYQFKSGYEGSVSVFLHTDRPAMNKSGATDGGGDLYFSLNLMALDNRGSCIKETLCGTKLHKFKARSDRQETANYGFYDFIENQDLLDRVLYDGEPKESAVRTASVPDLLPEAGEKSPSAILHLYCQVIVYSSVITKLKHVNENPSMPFQRLSLLA